MVENLSRSTFMLTLWDIIIEFSFFSGEMADAGERHDRRGYFLVFLIGVLAALVCVVLYIMCA